ncbi:uncharacterized protein TRIADDRAFT_56422 [Trichoplax adhaerens]|uniref:G-protein coupled receptors family 1 profile domain-containing protein n=1 Tax=Trichoplax adhaerens TaxID=10228 RepID=B3RY33_TRIAD|nr:hypothetical protein TRIADDRAFT_56422 [Trichoplax adhaerens]EDV24966.1 hypothetical protein TRIADDRAFT_56422 [Trichoplax adhaerens]|eukprot:XP_002112856.1 hypothetical protein TRIADDRAFT_56422 [Trichoplax adhaerens]
MLTLIWILPVVSILTLVTYRKINLENCTYDYEFGQSLALADAISATATSAVLFFIPLSVVIIVYTRIFFVIKSHTKELYAGKDSKTIKKKVNRNYKAIIQMVVLIGVFVIMWLPFAVLSIVASLVIALVPSSDISFVPLVTYALIFRFLAYSYPLIHPVMYSYFNVPMKMELLRYFYQCIGREEVFRHRLQTGQGTVFSVHEGKSAHTREINVSSIGNFENSGNQENYQNHRRLDSRGNNEQKDGQLDKLPRQKVVRIQESLEYLSALRQDGLSYNK